MNSRFRHKRHRMDGMRNAITVLFCLSLLSAYPAAPSAAHSDRVPQHVTERFAISLSAVVALEALTSGRMTSEQYVDVLLQRIANHLEINAFVHLDPDQAREAARLADQQRAAGQSLGPLHGLPILIKDSISTAGMPTTAGTSARLVAARPATIAGPSIATP